MGISKQTVEEICRTIIAENQESVATKEDFNTLTGELLNYATNEYILKIVQGIHDKYETECNNAEYVNRKFADQII